MKRTAPLLGLILIAVLSHPARAEWVSFGGAPGTPPEVTLKVDSPGLAEIEVRVLGFDLADTTIDGNTYSLVSLPGDPRLTKRGDPALPKVSRSIIIPDMAHMALEIIDESQEQMTVPPVLPSRGIIMRSENPDTVSYVFSKLYEEGGMFPVSAAGLGRPYILRDFRGVVAHVHPFSHDPVSGSLIIRTRTTVRVYEDGIDSVNVKTNSRTGRGDPSFIALYDNHFMNYPGQDNRYDLLPETGDILIIAADGYDGNSYLESFVDWKKRRGHHVHFYTCSETDPPASNGDNLIQVVSDKYLYEIPNLDFVILVGDGAEFASQYCVPAPWDDVENDNRNDPADKPLCFHRG